MKKIRILVGECQFRSPDKHIIVAIVFGSNSRRTQTKLLEKDATLTLDTALDIARTEEVTSNQIKGITTDNSTRIDTLKRGQALSNAANQPSKPRGPIIRLCGCCGSEHDISQRSLCPAFGSICGACGKENHWRRVCRSSKPNRKQKNARGGSKHSKSSKERRGAEKHLRNLETQDERVVQYSDKFMHGIVLYFLHITILYKSLTIKNEAKQ